MKKNNKNALTVLARMTPKGADIAGVVLAASALVASCGVAVTSIIVAVRW